MEAVAVKERPILFSGPMVNAILEGRKTQTRRVQGLDSVQGHDWYTKIIKYLRDQKEGFVKAFLFIHKQYPEIKETHLCPYGQVGDRLWVREAFCYKYDSITEKIIEPYEIWYRASSPDVVKIGDNGMEEGSPWKPSILLRCEA